LNENRRIDDVTAAILVGHCRVCGDKITRQLSCCWDGRAVLHKSNSEKMWWVSFLEKYR